MRFAFLLALFSLAGFALQGKANAQQITYDKKLCFSGDHYPPPATCQPPLTGQVPEGQAVFYVVSVTNLEPGTTSINVADTTPAGFVSSGAPTCTQTLATGATSPTPWPPAGIGSFNAVPAGANILCTVPGYFANSANSILTVTNSVQMSTGSITSNTLALSSTITVSNSQGLSADLSLTKTARWQSQPGPLNITSTSQIVTYTITLKNAGPANINIGPSFILHDELALMPNSGPLNVTLLPNQLCQHFAGTVLQTSGPQADCLAVPAAQISSITVGTMGWQALADWNFGTQNGYLAAGDSLVLTYDVKVETVPGKTCVAVANSDGLLNRSFFDLHRKPGSTLTEINPGNNFSDNNPPGNHDSDVPVLTGYTVDPHCASGSVTFTKDQTSPPAGTVVPWGTPVSYVITITNNTSQFINITDMKDFVVEGIGTPPFTSTWISSSMTGVSGNPANFTSYGQMHQQWPALGQQVSFGLAAGQTVTINIQFTYQYPDCDTVPVVNPKPIYNVAKIIYMDPGSWNLVTQSATAQTNMAPQPPCQFKVTKRGPKILFGASPVLHFGSTRNYSASFTNNGGPRFVGTLLDAVRLTDVNYATPTFTSSWNCIASAGVTTSGNLFGGPSGSVIYTTLPTQGSVVMQLTNVFFPTNGTISCNIAITVNRPAFTDPKCSNLPTYLENLALMDVTDPYNLNVPFPPSGSYVLGGTSPSTQNLNWVTVDTPLPKCFDAQVNKTASVSGLPLGSPPWTSPSGPQVNYQINVSNVTNFPLTGTPGSPWNGLIVTDTLSPALAGNVTAGSPLCFPLVWCASGPSPLSQTTELGVQAIAPASTGVWNLVLNPQPAHLTPGTSITNCAEVKPSGSFTGADWYPYYDPANPPASLKSCGTVPVLETATLRVIKDVVNKTTPSIPATTTYSVTVNCAPYQTTTTTLNLANGPPGQSIIVPVASGETCTVTENQSSLPALPNHCKLPNGMVGPGFWELPAVVPAGPILITSAGQYTVHVLNVASCIPLDRASSLTIEKVVEGPAGPVPTTAFAINVTCNGQAWQPTPTLSNNGSTTQFLAPNTHCTVSEVPQLPNFNSGKNCPLGAVWLSPTYSPSQTVTTTLNQASLVVVTNRYVCQEKHIGFVPALKPDFSADVRSPVAEDPDKLGYISQDDARMVPLKPLAVKLGGMALDLTGVRTVGTPGRRGPSERNDAEGLIPGRLLRKYEVVFDYPARRFTLATPGTTKPRGLKVKTPISPSWAFRASNCNSAVWPADFCSTPARVSP